MNFYCHSPISTKVDRKQDILFLAQWAKDYSPFVELNQKYKNCPNYDPLKSRYLELAEKAKDDEEFFQIVNGYFRLIGASGHASILFESDLKYYINEFKKENPTNITIKQYEDALYWARLIQNIAVFAHPPFQIINQTAEYFVNDNWQHNNKIIPKGSKIQKVNGLTYSAYLEFVKQHTWIRYLAHNRDWIDNYLLIIDEGVDFKGWRVEFLLPDYSVFTTIVPKIIGFHSAKENSDNCSCFEIADDVGYIRIKSFSFWSIQKDGNLMRDFFDKSGGKYKKLIIDIRNNGGGATEYFYNNLIKPFLDEPAIYKQKVGIRKKFLSDMKPSYLNYLRKHVSTKAQGVTDILEIESQEGFDSNEWIFYEITRKINPLNRYNFNGKIYILTENCFSAADDYANIAKRIGLGTLVGRNTNGGGAAYFAPVFVRLPFSGIIFMLEADLLLNPDGTFNELFGTKPDVELEPFDFMVSDKKSELKNDEWIKAIITQQ